MSPHKTKWFAIVVHYGEVEGTTKLVKSLLGEFWKIVVIDHGPQSSPLSFDEEGTVVIRPSTNSGYGGGIEVGLGVLFNFNPNPSDMVVILNNDIHLRRQALKDLKTWWLGKEKPMIAGLKIGSLNVKTGRTSITTQSSHLDSQTLAYLHGSLISGPYHVIRALHIPQHYFMYWEDVFLSIHATGQGIQLAEIKNLPVQHDESTNMTTDNHTYYLVRNGALYLEHETPGHWKKYWWLRNRLRLLYHFLPTQNPQRKIVKKALVDAIRNRTGQVSL